MRDLIKTAVIILVSTLLFCLIDNCCFANTFNITTPTEVIQKNGLLTDNAKQNILNNTHFINEVMTNYNKWSAFTFVIYDRVYFLSSNGNNIRRFSNNTANNAYNTWTPYNNNSVLNNNYGTIVFNLDGTYRASTSGIAIGSATPDYVYTDIPINITNGFSMDAGEYGGSYVISTFEFFPTYDSVGRANLGSFTTGFSINNYNRPPVNWELGYTDYSGDIGYELQKYDGFRFLPYSSVILSKSYTNNHYYLWINDSFQIDYNNLYKLVITVGENIYEYYYMFKPLNSTGGAIYIGSGEYVFSGDISVGEPTTEELVSGVYDEFKLFSSGVVSGDLLFPSFELEDPTEEFYTYWFSGFMNALIYSGDSYVSIVFDNDQNEDYELVVRASQFSWSVPVLDQFLDIVWSLGFCYSLFKFLHNLYMNMIELNTQDVMKSVKFIKDIL